MNPDSYIKPEVDEDKQSNYQKAIEEAKVLRKSKEEAENSEDKKDE